MNATEIGLLSLVLMFIGFYVSELTSERVSGIGLFNTVADFLHSLSKVIGIISTIVFFLCFIYLLFNE